MDGGGKFLPRGSFYPLFSRFELPTIPTTASVPTSNPHFRAGQFPGNSILLEDHLATQPRSTTSKERRTPFGKIHAKPHALPGIGSHKENAAPKYRQHSQCRWQNKNPLSSKRAEHGYLRAQCRQKSQEIIHHWRNIGKTKSLKHQYVQRYRKDGCRSGADYRFPHCKPLL